MPVQNNEKVDARKEALDYQAKKTGSVSSKKAKGTKYKSRPDTIIIAGRARVPEGITAKHVFGCLTIELEVDPVNSVVVDISCTLVPHLGEKILSNALLGNKIEEGIKEAITQLNKRFFNVIRRALIAALEDAYRWYKKALEKRAQNSETGPVHR